MILEDSHLDGATVLRIREKKILKGLDQGRGTVWRGFNLGILINIDNHRCRNHGEF